MTYEFNGEKKELHFIDGIIDINKRSSIVDIIAHNYVKDGCPPLLRDNVFILGYFALMTDAPVDDDNVLISIFEQIKFEDLKYYKEMHDAYIERVNFLISESGIKVKIYETLSNLNKLILTYSNPKNTDKMLKSIVKEFGKLDKEHLELVMSYLKSSTPFFGELLQNKNN